MALFPARRPCPLRGGPAPPRAVSLLSSPEVQPAARPPPEPGTLGQAARGDPGTQWCLVLPGRLRLRRGCHPCEDWGGLQATPHPSSHLPVRALLGREPPPPRAAPRGVGAGTGPAGLAAIGSRGNEVAAAASPQAALWAFGFNCECISRSRIWGAVRMAGVWGGWAVGGGGGPPRLAACKEQRLGCSGAGLGGGQAKVQTPVWEAHPSKCRPNPGGSCPSSPPVSPLSSASSLYQADGQAPWGQPGLFSQASLRGRPPGVTSRVPCRCLQEPQLRGRRLLQGGGLPCAHVWGVTVMSPTATGADPTRPRTA